VVWVKFPNQINDLLKLRAALTVAATLTPTELRDDGAYGRALLDAGVIRTGKTPQELAALPTSRQPQRTTARVLRQQFILLGCMIPAEGGIHLTQPGQSVAAQIGEALTASELEIWRELISQLRFPHPLYPDLSEGVASVRPAQVILAMLEPGPLPAQGLAVAFAVADESQQRIGNARQLAAGLTTQTAAQIATQIGTTPSELRNNAKVFPGLMEQVGLIRRESGTAWIEPAGLIMLGAPAAAGEGAHQLGPPLPLPTPRQITPGPQTAWAPEPVDPNDLAERARMRLLRQERASIDHQTAVELASQWLTGHGFETFAADYDIWACRHDLWLLIEVKSLGAASVRRQTTSAIGQLAYYARLSLPEPPAGTRLVRAVLYDRDPRNQLATSVLDAEGIAPMWIHDGTVIITDPDLKAAIER